jgi:hypothetical protein
MLGVSAEGAGFTKENFIVFASTPLSCLVEKHKLYRKVERETEVLFICQGHCQKCRSGTLPLGFLLTVAGIFLIIHGFSPEEASNIIGELGDIVKELIGQF